MRHIAPNTVYIEESLASEDVVNKIRDWVGQVVVVLGLNARGLSNAQREDEAEVTVSSNSGLDAKKEWWMDKRKVGPGAGIEVVDLGRLEEDWSKRILR